MKMRQLPAASAEFEEAIAWYAERSPQSAEAFWQEVERAKRRIVEQPEAAPVVRRRSRRFILRHFPYDVVYLAVENEIVVIAYAHHKRRPGYWQDRLRNVH